MQIFFFFTKWSEVVADCTSALLQDLLMFDVSKHNLKSCSRFLRATKSLIRNTLLCNEYWNVELILRRTKRLQTFIINMMWRNRTSHLKSMRTNRFSINIQSKNAEDSTDMIKDAEIFLRLHRYSNKSFFLLVKSSWFVLQSFSVYSSKVWNPNTKKIFTDSCEWILDYRLLTCWVK